jgi:hypothetical protein
MTKKLEDLFDLADPVEAEEFYKSRKLNEEEAVAPVVPEPKEELPVVMPIEAPVIDLSKGVTNVVDMGDRINSALPTVHDTQTTDPDMDRYADKAEKAFEDLMDLGFNVEDRNAGHVFAAAKDMLKNAIEAKGAKADRKLKAIELQIKKMRLDQNVHKEPKVIESEDFIVSDRNSMLSALSQNNDK